MCKTTDPNTVKHFPQVELAGKLASILPIDKLVNIGRNNILYSKVQVCVKYAKPLIQSKHRVPEKL